MDETIKRKSIYRNTQSEKLILSDRLFFPEDHPDLEGHFNGYPIIPGISQINIVLERIEKYLGHAVKISKLTRVRFSHKLIPPVSCQLTITWYEEKKISWYLAEEEIVYSKGVLTYV